MTPRPGSPIATTAIWPSKSAKRDVMTHPPARLAIVLAGQSFVISGQPFAYYTAHVGDRRECDVTSVGASRTECGPRERSCLLVALFCDGPIWPPYERYKRRWYRCMLGQKNLMTGPRDSPTRSLRRAVLATRAAGRRVSRLFGRIRRSLDSTYRNPSSARFVKPREANARQSVARG